MLVDWRVSFRLDGFQTHRSIRLDYPVFIQRRPFKGFSVCCTVTQSITVCFADDSGAAVSAVAIVDVVGAVGVCARSRKLCNDDSSDSAVPWRESTTNHDTLSKVLPMLAVVQGVRSISSTRRPIVNPKYESKEADVHDNSESRAIQSASVPKMDRIFTIVLSLPATLGAPDLSSVSMRRSIKFNCCTGVGTSLRPNRWHLDVVQPKRVRAFLCSSCVRI